MRTEDIELNIKERFIKKRIPIEGAEAEIALARNLAKEFIDYLLEIRRRWLK